MLCQNFDGFLSKQSALGNSVEIGFKVSWCNCQTLICIVVKSISKHNKTITYGNPNIVSLVCICMYSSHDFYYI